VHRAHELVHLLKCGIGWADNYVDTVTDDVQLVVVHEDGQLDESVFDQIEAGHLAVNPD
jgi:fructose 1,6-bisphosphatase